MSRGPAPNRPRIRRVKMAERGSGNCQGVRSGARVWRNRPSGSRARPAGWWNCGARLSPRTANRPRTGSRCRTDRAETQAALRDQPLALRLEPMHGPRSGQASSQNQEADPRHGAENPELQRIPERRKVSPRAVERTANPPKPPPPTQRCTPENPTERTFCISTTTSTEPRSLANHRQVPETDPAGFPNFSDKNPPTAVNCRFLPRRPCGNGYCMSVQVVTKSNLGTWGAMVRVAFTPNLQRHVSCPPVVVSGTTVREVLEAAFADNEQARGYVLDDRGALRKHINVFINGVQIHDRSGLSDPVPDGSELYVFQALSGG
jgi:molybdopterin synthase sulfur carrier subunit